LGDGRLVESLATPEALLRLLESPVDLGPALGQTDRGAAVLHEPAIRRGADVPGASGCRLGTHALELGEQARVPALGAALVSLAEALVDIDHLLAECLDGLAGGQGGVELVGDGGQGGAGLGQLG